MKRQMCCRWKIPHRKRCFHKGARGSIVKYSGPAHPRKLVRSLVLSCGLLFWRFWKSHQHVLATHGMGNLHTNERPCSRLSKTSVSNSKLQTPESRSRRALEGLMLWMRSPETKVQAGNTKSEAIPCVCSRRSLSALYLLPRRPILKQWPKALTSTPG